MPKSRKNFIEENKVETQQGRDTFAPLAAQVQEEYDLAWKHQYSKKKEWEVRLKLYNNQRRNKEAVGDTTLFTIHQTILASLYIDRLNVTFEAREEGDEEVAENLNALALFDYDEMSKEVLDYNWIWDTAFFGHGLIAMDEYERDTTNGVFVPVARVLDPMVFLRDPYAVTINGDRKGRGGARFYGQEVRMTRKQLDEHPHIFDEVDFDTLKFGAGNKSLIGDATDARSQAQGLDSPIKKETEKQLGANAMYTLTEWSTHYGFNGKVEKVRVWLANDRGKVIGIQKTGLDYWEVVDRLLYPTSHDWDGTSIPDLVEDKQRARAMAQNLGLDYMKADLYPMYIYDTNKIVNKNDLSFNFNKFIPVNPKDTGTIQNSVIPLVKSQPNLQLLNFIMESLDVSAQKATATPEIQQGMASQEQRTLGEVNIIASKVETRYSLAAKVFGWSEKRFWLHWYKKYKDNFGDKIDKKVVRLGGAFGAKWRPLAKDNIIANTDPDIQIESQVVSRAKQFEERAALTQYLAMALNDPGVNRRYGLKKLGKTIMKKDEVDRLFPLTIDEREAQDENELLNNGKYVPVEVEQDHNSHLEVHSKLNDTPEARAHIKTHEEALKIKRSKPELFPTAMDGEAADINPPGSTQLAPQAPQTPSKPVTPAQAPQAGPIMQ